MWEWNLDWIQILYLAAYSYYWEEDTSLKAHDETESLALVPLVVSYY